MKGRLPMFALLGLAAAAASFDPQDLPEAMAKRDPQDDPPPDVNPDDFDEQGDAVPDRPDNWETIQATLDKVMRPAVEAAMMAEASQCVVVDSGVPEFDLPNVGANDINDRYDGIHKGGPIPQAPLDPRPMYQRQNEASRGYDLFGVLCRVQAMRADGAAFRLFHR